MKAKSDRPQSARPAAPAMRSDQAVQLSLCVTAARRAR